MVGEVKGVEMMGVFEQRGEGEKGQRVGGDSGLRNIGLGTWETRETRNQSIRSTLELVFRLNKRLLLLFLPLSIIR